MLEKVTVEETQQCEVLFVTERIRHSGNMIAHARLFPRVSLRAAVQMDARGREF